MPIQIQLFIDIYTIRPNIANILKHGRIGTSGTCNTSFNYILNKQFNKHFFNKHFTMCVCVWVCVCVCLGVC